MALTNISDWNDFFYKVGENFYDLVNSTGGDENTPVVQPILLEYDGLYQIQVNSGQSRDYSVPFKCHFKFGGNSEIIADNFQPCYNSNQTSSYVLDDLQYYLDNVVINTSLSVVNYESWFPWLSSNSQLGFRSSSGQYANYVYNVCNYEFSRGLKTDNTVQHYNSYQNYLNYNYGMITEQHNINGYEYYFSSSGSLYNNSSYSFSQNTPKILVDYPVVMNTNTINSSNTVFNNVRNYYINHGDTITTYNYTTNQGDNITINYSVDSDNLPTGYIDIPVNPQIPISFDDLFDMFNTILAPLVGIGLDLPDWTDYEPQYPIVTGDINVNIDIPDITGEYPAETITPIESDVYNIMPLDSLPQLPSLTGIDNGESAAALGSSFSFLDGCGLLMPFVTIAIIRLLISKFRGDS